MTDNPGWLDPSLAAGPRRPQEVLRPLINEQRILLLDGPFPEMIDLATGDIRRWENGPPLALPCVSAPFALGQYRRIMVQVLRDPRPASTDLVLVSLAVADRSVDVVERQGGVLSITQDGVSVDGPIGGSAAIVTEFGIGEDGTVDVSVRNAESTDGHNATARFGAGRATLTLGGPSTHLTGVVGRRRPSSLHIEASRRPEPVDQIARAARLVRRAARTIQGRGR